MTLKTEHIEHITAHAIGGGFTLAVKPDMGRVLLVKYERVVREGSLAEESSTMITAPTDLLLRTIGAMLANESYRPHRGDMIESLLAGVAGATPDVLGEFVVALERIARDARKP